MNAEILNSSVTFAPILNCVPSGGVVLVMLGAFVGSIFAGLLALGNIFLIPSRCHSGFSMVANYGLLTACAVAFFGAFRMSGLEFSQVAAIAITAPAIVIGQFVFLVSRKRTSESL